MAASKCSRLRSRASQVAISGEPFSKNNQVATGTRARLPTLPRPGGVVSLKLVFAAEAEALVPVTPLLLATIALIQIAPIVVLLVDLVVHLVDLVHLAHLVHLDLHPL